MPAWCRYWTLVVAILASFIYLLGDPPAGGPTIAIAILVWSLGTLGYLVARALTRSVLALTRRLWARFGDDVMEHIRHPGELLSAGGMLLFWGAVGLLLVSAHRDSAGATGTFVSKVLAMLPSAMESLARDLLWSELSEQERMSALRSMGRAVLIGAAYGIAFIVAIVLVGRIPWVDTSIRAWAKRRIEARALGSPDDYPYLRRYALLNGWTATETARAVGNARGTAAPDDAVWFADGRWITAQEVDDEELLAALGSGEWQEGQARAR